MSSDLAELQARQTVKRLQLLKLKLNTFAMHAKTLRGFSGGKNGVDERHLLEEANQLLRELGDTVNQYKVANAKSASISRSLPGQPGAVGGAWKFELRTASEQFVNALRAAESEIKLLQQTSMSAMNQPLRTPTMPGDPGLENVIDLILGFSDAIAKWLESRQRAK